jgi:hypothetical protein
MISNPRYPTKYTKSGLHELLADTPDLQHQDAGGHHGLDVVWETASVSVRLRAVELEAIPLMKPMQSSLGEWTMLW